MVVERSRVALGTNAYTLSASFVAS
ncbi:hypothetical protein LINGRAHAP2_LOCUS8373 [Linum grandiflorum]